MSLRPILTWPNPCLSMVCRPIDVITPDVRELAADMLDTMYDAPGRGLAAPQVGALLRLFVMDAGWKDGTPTPVVCINPDLLDREDAEETGGEGCLSLPGVTAQVRRATAIRMVWTDLDGIVHDERLAGFSALCAQHEMDHLDGIMTLDRVDADQRAALIAEYEGLH